jgi:hypothetical protein
VAGALLGFGTLESATCVFDQRIRETRDRDASSVERIAAVTLVSRQVSRQS